jgi:hypothetical protein
MVSLHGGQALVARGTATETETANVSLYPMFVAATTPFALLATGFFFARLYSRMVPARLHWDDYLVASGYVRFEYPSYTTYTTLTSTQLLAMATWGVTFGIQSTTGGRHIQFISLANIQKALHYYFIAGFVGPYANLFIKASVCAMLLRIMQGNVWRIGVWSLLATFVVIFLVITVTNVLECSPLFAFWNITERNEKCWPSSTISIIANVMGGTPHFPYSF